MIKNTTILSASLFLSAVLALSVLARSDFGTPAFAQGMIPKMHLEEGIKALKAGDNQGALMHLNEINPFILPSGSSSHFPINPP
jgi:hypothetical protein